MKSKKKKQTKSQFTDAEIRAETLLAIRGYLPNGFHAEILLELLTLQPTTFLQLALASIEALAIRKQQADTQRGTDALNKSAADQAATTAEVDAMQAGVDN